MNLCLELTIEENREEASSVGGKLSQGEKRVRESRQMEEESEQGEKVEVEGGGETGMKGQDLGEVGEDFWEIRAKRRVFRLKRLS